MPEFKDYWQYRITTDAAQKAALSDLLGSLPFEGIEETENELLAYIPIEEEGEDLVRQLIALQAVYPFEFERQWFPGQNWNAVWESNFQPVTVGDFCHVRALFHPSGPEVSYEIIIQPQMAFGTGHHETTYMMMDTMSSLDFSGSKVLDFGCGTGILGILACKMGAQAVVGVDIEQPAVENTRENLELNGITGFEVRLGDLDAIPESGFDILLANINRNVILATLEALYHKLKTNGILLVSGILSREEQLITDAAMHTGFRLVSAKERGEWSCFRFEK